jgi:hypothetical protein
MNVLLLNGTAKSIRVYAKKLKKSGIKLTTLSFTGDVLPWQNNKIHTTFLKVFCESLHKDYGETIDVIQFLVDQKDWKGRDNNRGYHIAQTFSGYEVCVVKHRKGWEDTAEHELMHTLDNLARRYLNIDIEKTVDVRDWDDDVVHGEDKRFKEYSYTKPFKAVWAVIQRALKVRRS